MWRICAVVLVLVGGVMLLLLPLMIASAIASAVGFGMGGFSIEGTDLVATYSPDPTTGAYDHLFYVAIPLWQVIVGVMVFGSGVAMWIAARPRKDRHGDTLA